MALLIDELFQEIDAKRTQHYADSFQPWPKTVPTASDLSSCIRETALGIIHGDMRPKPTVEMMQRFEVGHKTELRVIIALQELGFQVVEQQSPFQITGKDRKVILRGKIDGKLLWRGERFPFDVKSCHINAFDRLNGIEDFISHTFYSRYVRQLMSYLYLTDSEIGFLLLDDCMGHWKYVPIGMDYSFMEQVLRQCEIAVEAVEKISRGDSESEALPPYHQSVDVCQRCWARGRCCNPPRLADHDGLVAWEDPELESLIDYRQGLHPAHLEFNRVDKKLRELFKDHPSVLVGRWLVSGKEGSSHYKAAEARTIKTWSIEYQPIVPQLVTNEESAQ